MYQVNDLIIYGSSGVCRVQSIGVPKDIPGAEPGRSYYTMQPVFDSGTIRVPVDTKVFMRPVITREEVDRLIGTIDALPEDPGCTGSPQVLSEHYRSFFVSHRCEDLLLLLKALYSRKHSGGASGQMAGRTDQRYFEQAKNLLEQEFSVALDIPLSEVAPYIAQRATPLSTQS